MSEPETPILFVSMLVIYAIKGCCALMCDVEFFYLSLSRVASRFPSAIASNSLPSDTGIAAPATQNTRIDAASRGEEVDAMRT